MDGFRKAVKEKMAGVNASGVKDADGLQAELFQDMSEADVIAKVGPLFTEDQKTSGMLASVSLAQLILESGYGKSELAVKANNYFGVKKVLSGNSWDGSVWDGVSVYENEKSRKTEEKAIVQHVRFGPILFLKSL